MNISSWTVRMRLTVGFGLVCGLLLVILGVGLFSMSRIDEVVRSILDDKVPKIEAANTIELQANIQSVALRDMLLATEPTDRQKLGETVAQARTVSGKNVELLERLIVLPKGKELLARVKELRSKYVAGQEALLALINADKADDAKAFLNKELRPLLSSYMAGLGEGSLPDRGHGRHRPDWGRNPGTGACGDGDAGPGGDPAYHCPWLFYHP